MNHYVGEVLRAASGAARSLARPGSKAAAMHAVSRLVLLKNSYRSITQLLKLCQFVMYLITIMALS